MSDVPHTVQGAVALAREQRRDASRCVLRHARNQQDLRLLLAALGLDQPTPTTTEDTVDCDR